MADIFERIKRQYEAWKLEQKYMKRRRSRMMRKSTLLFSLFSVGSLTHAQTQSYFMCMVLMCLDRKLISVWQRRVCSIIATFVSRAFRQIKSVFTKKSTKLDQEIDDALNKGHWEAVGVYGKSDMVLAFAALRCVVVINMLFTWTMISLKITSNGLEASLYTSKSFDVSNNVSKRKK